MARDRELKVVSTNPQNANDSLFKTMRIHLDLPRDRFISTPSTSSSSTAPTLSGPFIRLGLKRPHAVTPGGAQEEEEEEEEVVMIELQGELDFEGGNEGGPGGKVIGLLGLERMVSG